MKYINTIQDRDTELEVINKMKEELAQQLEKAQVTEESLQSYLTAEKKRYIDREPINTQVMVRHF